MQQRLPALVRLRLAKSLSVIFQPPPANKKKVAVRLLNASLQLVRKISGRCADDPLRFPKRGLELLRLMRLHFEDG